MTAATLSDLFARSITEAELPGDEILATMKQLREIPLEDLRSLSREAGIKIPERTKFGLLSRIERKLTAGRRVMEQTEQ